MKNVKKIVIYAVIVIAVIGAIVVKNKLSSNTKNANVPVTVSKTAVEVQNAKAVEKRFDFNKDLGRLREWYKHDIIVLPLFNIYGSLLGYTIEVNRLSKINQR